ncbi:MAG: hypothetical protein NTX50_08495 [Candidatus Sumerlaeota bacterium]|nr:hypothetical protein [Candidatus Sumerlaeota bacterium]
MDASRWLAGSLFSIVAIMGFGLSERALSAAGTGGIYSMPALELETVEPDWGPASDDETITGPTVYLSGPSYKPAQAGRPKSASASFQLVGGAGASPQDDGDEIQRAIELQKIAAAQDAAKNSKAGKSAKPKSNAAKSNTSKTPASELAKLTQEDSEEAFAREAAYSAKGASLVSAYVPSLMVTSYGGVIW